MPEDKKVEVRPLQVIQQEYTQLCTKAGDLQYKIRCFQTDLETVNGQLLSLNHEAVTSQEAAAKEADEKATAEAEKQPELPLAEAPKAEVTNG